MISPIPFCERKRVHMSQFLTLLMLFNVQTFAAPPRYEATTQSFRQTLEALVQAKMVNPPGDEKKAVAIIGARLKKENIPFQSMDFGPNRSNLVARLKGNGEKRPLLLLAHLDVVGVDHQTWTFPPHELTEKEGFLYGRGVQDDLGMAVANLEIFIALKKLNVPLKRDVILAFTGDEESGGAGIKALIEKHPDWIGDAEIGLNEGGSPITDDKEKVLFLSMASAEKTYQDFSLKVVGQTGHSSLPQGANAIGVLSQAVDRINKHKPQARLLPVTRSYFQERAKIEAPEIAKLIRQVLAAKGKIPEKVVDALMSHPTLGSQLITTCIPTMLHGGSRVNALPPEATANINCRILPDETIASVKKRIAGIINDPRVEIKTEGDFSVGGASDIEGPVPSAVRKISQEFWPKSPLILSMLNGATDSRFLRTQTQMYGLSPLPRLEKDSGRAHGIDERIPVSSIRVGLEFYYRLVVELAGE